MSTFSLCRYDMQQDKVFFAQKMEADYNQVLNYLNAVRKAIGDDVQFVCGYEAGCLGFTLYHQLTRYGVNCVILAPTTMSKPTGKKKIKTAKRGAENIVEVGDFKRFPSAERFASYIGLVPGEDSSGGDQNRLGITKAENRHVRMLLVEAAQSFSRGQIGCKSAALKQRQSGNAPEIIAYADRANERLRRKYYKRSNVAKIAVARELSCFIWGMMTGNIA